MPNVFKHLMLFSLLIFSSCFEAQATEIAPVEMINQYSTLPRTVAADVVQSKKAAAPRKVEAKQRYAGINQRTAHLSSLDNEAVVPKRSHPQ